MTLVYLLFFYLKNQDLYLNYHFKINSNFKKLHLQFFYSYDFNLKYLIGAQSQFLYEV